MSGYETGSPDVFYDGFSAETIPMEERFESMLEVNYFGRLDFGTGSINAEDVSEKFFRAQLDQVADDGLTSMADFNKLYGICMDGRTVVSNELGSQVAPRPEVIGGPSGFGWYVATLGSFSLFKPGMTPLDQFIIVNKQLVEAGFQLGMHHICGAARGVQAVIERYGEAYDDINQYIGAGAQKVLKANAGRQNLHILHGIDATVKNIVNNGDDFTEDTMLAVVRDLSGPEAIVRLDQGTDDHNTAGHEEGGLLFVDIDNAVVNKSKLAGQLFVQNRAYARKIVKTLAGNDIEARHRGLAIADQLPIAAVSVLGKGQHVGEVSGQLAA